MSVNHGTLELAAAPPGRHMCLAMRGTRASPALYQELFGLSVFQHGFEDMLKYDLQLACLPKNAL